MADLKAKPGDSVLARLASCCWRKALRTCCGAASEDGAESGLRSVPVSAEVDLGCQ